MCRIFGCFGADASPGELQAASQRQLHGGPDGQYLLRGRGWALGANRLAIVDLAGGAQPYELGGICVVFNGEIYNHHRLRRDLINRGYRFPDACDGSILPALYAEYGPSFVDRLDGMYAIAVVDSRTTPHLLLATDHAGMKSLYYHWSPATKRLCFASELFGLFAFRDVPIDVADAGLETFFTLKHHPGPTTMFTGVRVLGPGQTLIVRDGEMTQHRRHPLQNDGDVGDKELSTLLADEVDAVLAADVPVCVVTSGGLDSSLITALASRRASSLHSFNVGYVGDWPGDERSYAQEMARHVGTTHHEVLIDPAAIPELLQRTISHLGQPNAAPICVSTFMLFDAIHDAGFKVALTGDGADELFGGYRHARDAVAAGDDWWQIYLRSVVATPQDLRQSVYTDDYRRAVLGGESVEQRFLPQPGGDGDILDRLTVYELGAKFPIYHLSRVDHLSMAHSVEARVPFCQQRVIAAARAISQGDKVVGDRGKEPLYRVASAYVPDAVLRRPKQPFTLPLAAMMHRVPALCDYAQSVLTDGSVRADGLLDVGRITALANRCRERPDGMRAQALWSLLVYQLWRDSVRRYSHRPPADVMQP